MRRTGHAEDVVGGNRRRLAVYRDFGDQQRVAVQHGGIGHGEIQTVVHAAAVGECGRVFELGQPHRFAVFARQIEYIDLRRSSGRRVVGRLRAPRRQHDQPVAGQIQAVRRAVVVKVHVRYFTGIYVVHVDAAADTIRGEGQTVNFFAVGLDKVGFVHAVHLRVGLRIARLALAGIGRTVRPAGTAAAPDE